jgi:lysophospholipase L1-like esterase
MKACLPSSILLLALVSGLAQPWPAVSADQAVAPAATAPAPKAAAKAAPIFKKLLPCIALADGDTLVFLGDSITHQCLYTQYIEDYYYTRYPKLRIHFHNAGVGGDKACDALDRFDADVAQYKPRYVTILLGMNDGAYRDFDKATFDTYQHNMSTLLDRIEAIGASAIPMTPTMHDARAARIRGKGAEPRDTYYNGVLALYGAWLREVAQVRGLGFVDMYSPLNQWTLAERKKDATFTLIQDSVHPGPAGQVVMAAAILDDMCPRSSVSAITIQEKAGTLAATAANGTVAGFQADGDGLRFTFTAKALPWVVPIEAAPGYELVHAGHHYSMEAFTARNLKPGKYELKIDGQSIGVWPDSQLAFRLELEGNPKTPQYQQALRVAMLNRERNEKAMRPLRDLWVQLKIRRRQLAQQAAKNIPQLPVKQEKFEKWLSGEFRPGIEKLNALARDYEEKIYQANQPVAESYELIRVK